MHHHRPAINWRHLSVQLERQLLPLMPMLVLITVAWRMPSILEAASSSSLSTATKGPNAVWPGTKCAMSEFTCTNGKCVQLNKFCDNQNDCGDSSDEPRFCTSMFIAFKNIYILWFDFRPYLISVKTSTTLFYTICKWMKLQRGWVFAQSKMMMENQCGDD